ncbi:MAG: helix-turn-helix domain-containing protein [Paraclostridium sp.]|uniref:helix-turn-helix domain-containing protein n=2 Tax=Bacteria TaxID=2 RepID=UPI003F391AA1
MFKKVEEWLEKNSLSMAWLAKELGEHSATVSNWKSRNSIPKAKLSAVASILGCTTEQLLSDEPLPEISDCPPETAALLIEAFGGVTICDRIHWSDIDDWLDGVPVGYGKYFIPGETSKQSFVTELPVSIGLSINEMGAPSDTIAVDAGLTVDDLENADYVLARYGSERQITAWQFRRIGPKEFLINQDPQLNLPPLPVSRGDWTLIGKILYSMRLSA